MTAALADPHSTAIAQQFPDGLGRERHAVAGSTDPRRTEPKPRLTADS